MSLYSGTLQEFMDKTCDEIVGEMLGKFPDHSFKEDPDEKEVDSWKISIPILKLIFSSYLKKEEREISKIFLEYEMPLLSYQRADCIITVGKKIVVLEFKNYPSKNKLDKMQLKGYIDALKSNLVNTQEFEISGYVFYTGKCPDFKEEKKEEEDITTYDDLKKEKSENKVVKKIKELLSEHNSAHDALKNREYKSKLISDLSDPEIRHNQMILHEGIKKFISSGVEQRCFIVEGGAGTGKTLLALQILRRKLREIERKEEEGKVEGEDKIRVSYVTSSKHMNDFFHSESLLSPYLDSRYAQSFNKIGNMVEKDLLICDETQNATDKEIETIIKNEKIKKIIFFFGENQFTNRGFPEELNNLKKLNKLSISELKLEKSYRFGASENNHLEKVESFLSDNGKRFEDNSDYVKVYCDIGDMIKKLSELKNENSIRTLASYSHENSKFPFSIDGKEDKYSFVYHKNAASDNEDPRITAYKFSYNDNESFSREVNGTTEYYLGMPSTVLGFEYDYVGIIWGKDLYYDSENKEWSYDVKFIKDKKIKDKKLGLKSNELLEILKNRYRVLLTRARKGCYIYFEHKETREYFEEVFNIKA